MTKDEDFVPRILRDPSPAIVVWIRIGNCATDVLLDWFVPLLPDVVREIEAGSRLIELRRIRS